MLEKKDKKKRAAEMAALFLPDNKRYGDPQSLFDRDFGAIRGKTMLLTGDAQGKDLAEAWDAIGMPKGPAHVHLMKVPHHGSNRNNPEVFLRFFIADHYVFSANGKRANPDPETIEAVVFVNQGERIHSTLYKLGG